MPGQASAQETPIEITTDHRCRLGELTDRLADAAAAGHRGEALASRAQDALAHLLDDGEFERCCLPAYLLLAPQRFERDVQLPIARAPVARLDTRVLLWPVGAKDGQHPHCDGWAVFMAVRGSLLTHEERQGEHPPERQIALGRPELLVPEQDVSHHIHNAGNEIGLTIHVFGT